MFRRRRSRLSDTIREATDPQLRSLRAEIAERQEAIAGLELELFEMRSSLAEFERALEARVRPLERQLNELSDELAKARREAERRAQWGERANQEGTPDVVSQFERAWRPSSPKAAERAAPAPSAERTSLRALYRELAKRFHPDLTTDPDQKQWREAVMAEINEAYQAKDLAALRALQDRPDRPPPAVEKTSEQLSVELQAEVIRLDAVIAKLKRQLDELAASELAQLQLSVSMARQAGRDLLAEIARDLEREIAEVKVELAALA